MGNFQNYPSNTNQWECETEVLPKERGNPVFGRELRNTGLTNLVNILRRKISMNLIVRITI
jgi:hypothetical protein